MSEECKHEFISMDNNADCKDVAVCTKCGKVVDYDE